VSIIIMAFGLATLIFGSLGGIFADRFDRRWLLTVINFLQASSIGLYFLVGGNFWGLILITFLYSSLNQFYIPVEAPSIPNLVENHQILVANSYFAFTNSAALILGFAAAGPISTTLGQSAPFVAGVILLTIAGISTSTLPPILSGTLRSASHSLKRTWSEFKEGISHFWQNSALHYPLLSLICIQLVNGMIITIAPAFMKQAIGINLNTGSLLVVGPLGAGILLGALLLPLEEKYYSKRNLIFIGFLGMGIMLFGLSFIEHFQDDRYLYYAIFGFVIGVFNAHIFAPSHSLIQTNALSHIRGRIYGSLYVLLQIAGTIPTVLIGLLADKLPITYIATILGIILIVFGLILRSRARLNSSLNMGTL
jgi:MFS family permease